MYGILRNSCFRTSATDISLCSRIVMAAIFLSISIGASNAGSFTVRDSIAMTRFSDPAAREVDAHINYSPDYRHFVVVTNRGLLNSDQVESNLSLFDMKDIAKFLMPGHDKDKPRPRLLSQLRGRLQTIQGDSYGSLIADITWSKDSKFVMYLGENSHGNRQLFRVNIGGGLPKALTPSDRNVQTYDGIADTVVYTSDVQPNPKSQLYGLPVNDAAVDITGVSLENLMFPEFGAYEPKQNLWLLRDGHRREIIDLQTDRPMELSAWSTAFKPAVAPDARTAIVMVPAKEIPKAWEAYTSALPGLQFKSTIPSSEKKSTFFWPSQYAVLDLDNGFLSPLVDEPTGRLLDYDDETFAAWSPDGSALLVSNIFLPSNVSSGKASNRASIPCAAAVFRMPSRKGECVVWVRGSEGSVRDITRLYRVVGGTFAKSSNELQLDVSHSHRAEIETYRYRNGSWSRVEAKNTGGDSRQTMSVELKQDLNVPPALWAADGAGREKEIWNPTLPLDTAQLGQASVYRWEDATGYEWSGSLVKPVGYEPGHRYPLIVQTHGFHNEHEFITDGAFTTAFAAREFAAAGFVVLEVRDRHDNMVTAVEAPNMVRGFESAIAQLDAAGIIDPHRVGIIGFSRTCYYVESALIDAPQRFAAASISDGVDQSYVQEILFGADRGYIEGEQIYGALPFGPGLKNWVSAAPGFHLDKVRAPLMITAITSGSVFQEWEIYSALRQQDKPVSFLYIPHGQHILQNPLERLASQQGNVDWFRFWLQGYEDPAPEKSLQYRRWEALCDLQAKQHQPAYCVRSKHRAD